MRCLSRSVRAGVSVQAEKLVYGEAFKRIRPENLMYTSSCIR